MRRSTPLLLAALFFLLISSPPASAAPDPVLIHVSPTGRDDGPGTPEQPLQTLTAARDMVRRLPERSRPVVVEIRGGRYALDRSLALGPEDSGTAESPITYRAVRGESVTITGARDVPAQAVTEVTDPAVRARLSPAVAARLRQIDLRSLGVVDLGVRLAEVTGADRPTGVHLLQGETQGHDARYPNQGEELRITAVQADGDNPIWQISDPIPFTWQPDPDLWVEGYPGFDWAYQVQSVTALNRADSTITLGSPSEFGSKAGQPFHFVHVLEGLDQPDEFFVDSKTGLMFFIPTGQPLSVTTLADPLISGRGVSHIRFEGIRFTASRGDGVRLADGAAIEIRNSSFSNLGLRAIRLSDVSDSVVDSVTISRVGSGGVEIGGGDRVALTPGRNVISNSRIRHFAETYPRYSPGIFLRGVGNSASHNEISDSPHLAIQVQGNDHTINHNYVHDVVQTGSDSGALYGGRDWTERGNVIRNNVFARVGSGAHDVAAIYLDDMMSGTTVRQNVVVDAAVGVQHNGRDNHITGNIFVRTARPVYVGNWSNTISGDDGILEEKLREVPYTSPAWAKYPHLANILDDEPRKQRYNSVISNALVETGPISVEEASPGAVAQLHNRRLAADSIVTGPHLQDYLIPAESQIRRVPKLAIPDLARVGPHQQGPIQPLPRRPDWALGIVMVAGAAGLLGAVGSFLWLRSGRGRQRPSHRGLG